MSIHYLLLICQTCCQPAVSPETVLGCIMYSRRFVRTSVAVCNRDSRFWEKHKYPLQPLRKFRQPRGEILPEWCFLRKQTCTHQCELNICHSIFPLTVSSLISAIFTHNHPVLPVHEYQPCRSYLWPPADLGSSFAIIPEVLYFCLFGFQKGFDNAHFCWDIVWMF